MRSTIQTKLDAALRRKYTHPRQVLRALGLDEDLVPLEGDEEIPAIKNHLAKDETDEEKLEKFRALLKAAGLTEADIDQAVRLAKGGSATDRLPCAAISATDERGRALLETKLDARYGLGRVGVVGAPVAADQRTVVMGPSRASVSRFETRYPNASRIG